MMNKLSRGMEKWGHYLLALLCAAVILLSSLWTREQKAAEQENQAALSDQSQRLAQAAQEPTPVPWQRPASGPILRGFSMEPVFFPETGVWMLHPALDFSVEAGETVAALASGTVTACDGAVRIDHGNGYESICKGLAEITVHPGQRVRAGDPIGTAGGVVLYEGSGHVCVQLLENGAPIPYETE